MKNLILVVFVSITLFSCKQRDLNFIKTDINSIPFYDFNNKSISVEEITNQWNKRIQESESINARISKLEITNLVDETNNKSELILLGNTNKTSIKTATKLTKFKNGLKLSDVAVTCKNCHNDLNVELSGGDWSCIGKDNLDACTKIETLQSR